MRSGLGKLKRFIFNTIDNGAVVLLYHRVISLEKDPQLLAVSPENFYSQIEVLKKNFKLLTIDDFYDILYKKRRFPKKTVILTFDDGYADNLQFALPVLESLNAQALFYISTALLGTPYEMWWDDLERIILNSAELPENIELKIRNSTIRFDLVTNSDRFKAYNRLHDLLKYIPVLERDSILRYLQTVAGVKSDGRKEYLMMNAEQVYQLSLSPAAIIGAHTHNHPSLSILDYEMQTDEMQTSKYILEKIIQKEIIHFSYPFGSRNDFNKVSIQAAKATGFKMVCANYYGQVHKWTNRFAIPRILMRNWDLPEFRQQVKNFVKY